MSTQTARRERFYELAKFLFERRGVGEHLSIQYEGEDSLFSRINAGRVRQSGQVLQESIAVKLFKENFSSGIRTLTSELSLTGEIATDQENLRNLLVDLQSQIDQIDLDQFATLPTSDSNSDESFAHSCYAIPEVYDDFAKAVRERPLTGFLAGGSVYKGHASSAGARHWFETTLFNFDYSVFNNCGQMAKGYFSNRDWSGEALRENIDSTSLEFREFEKPTQSCGPGPYRVYLGPMAVAEIHHLFSWGFIGESSIRRGDSSLGLVRKGKKHFSPLYSLENDFSLGITPRFNQSGDLAPLHLPLISEGRLLNTLISKRTAKEYKLQDNAALTTEALTSPVIGAGQLTEANILEKLDDGLLLNNLHYLNWSDRMSARITGMTRYACFRVIGGKVLGPIENLRFDDSIFSLFGEQLEELSQVRQLVPNVDTYERRGLGGVKTPGMLIKQMNFTL